MLRNGEDLSEVLKNEVDVRVSGVNEWSGAEFQVLRNFRTCDLNVEELYGRESQVLSNGTDLSLKCWEMGRNRISSVEVGGHESQVLRFGWN